MKILALDIATVTGWATAESDGTWNFKTKPDESAGMKLIRLRSKLTEIHGYNPVDIIVWEKPAGRFPASIIHQSRMIGVVMAFCEENGIQWREYSASEIKKHATGKGNANKQKMVEAACRKWNDRPIIDDNHADALWLYDLAMKDLMIN